MIRKSVAAQREAERVIAKYKMKGVLSPSPAKGLAGAGGAPPTRQQLAFQEAPRPSAREGGALGGGEVAGARRDHEGWGELEQTVPSASSRRTRGTTASFSLEGQPPRGLPGRAREGFGPQHTANQPRVSTPSLGDEDARERRGTSPDARLGSRNMIDAMTASTAELRSFLSNGGASSEPAASGERDRNKRSSSPAPDSHAAHNPSRSAPKTWASPPEECGARAHSAVGTQGGREGDVYSLQHLRRGGGMGDAVGARAGQGADATDREDVAAVPGSEAAHHQLDPVNSAPVPHACRALIAPRSLRCLLLPGAARVTRASRGRWGRCSGPASHANARSVRSRVF